MSEHQADIDRAYWDWVTENTFRASGALRGQRGGLRGWLGRALVRCGRWLLQPSTGCSCRPGRNGPESRFGSVPREIGP